MISNHYCLISFLLPLLPSGDGNLDIMALTASKVFFSQFSVLSENSNQPIAFWSKVYNIYVFGNWNTTVGSPCHKSFEDNSLPSSSLASIKSLAQRSNSSQLSSTNWLIFVLASRLRLSILLWWKAGHQPQRTRRKQRRRMRRCNADEAMAHTLQSTVPERERKLHVTENVIRLVTFTNIRSKNCA